MEENKRKAIGKKLRFEVFKRDSFTCQYCGRSAPDVVLEVDHIKPVCSGGKNSIINLITSCMACNRGKGKILLTDKQAIKKEKNQLDELNEKRMQMEMMVKWRKELLEISEKQLEVIESTLLDDGMVFSEYGKRRFLTLIKTYGFNEVCEAAELSLKYDKLEERIDKIGGICYNRKRGVSF